MSRECESHEPSLRDRESHQPYFRGSMSDMNHVYRERET